MKKLTELEKKRMEKQYASYYTMYYVALEKQQTKTTKGDQSK